MILRREKMRLGDILIQQGYLNQEQLNNALIKQKKGKQRLGDYLVNNGIVSDDDIARAIHVQSGIEFIHLRGMTFSDELISLVSGNVLRKHNVLPLHLNRDTNELILAMSNPFDIVAEDDIAMITNCNIEARIATSGEINAVLDKHFGADEAMSAADEYTRGRGEEEEDLNEDDLNNAPIVALVRSTIEQAVRQRASDVHFDALEKSVRVRYRIDGELIKKMVYDINLLPALTTRIKIICGMDISEKRKPQDGRTSMIIDRVEYDIRVSMLPSYYGEKIVLRIANSIMLMRGKAELGLRSEEMVKFDSILSKPNGILLVTGPTGSGKSTTLYTALSEKNEESVNIITVEDPVEASIPGINQVQVNVKAGLTFSGALRSILRQDPDIIMVGEIRDRETAGMAIQASITGHFVVSTLHTNSAAASIARLLDMEVESFLIGDSLTGIIAQRLVRKLCNSCKEKHEATAEEKRILGRDSFEDLVIYEPSGCEYCFDTGYYGRTGVYEVMEITPDIKRLIVKKKSTSEIQNAAIENGMATLRMNVVQYVLEGTTSIKEMMKISLDE